MCKELLFALILCVASNNLPAQQQPAAKPKPAQELSANAPTRAQLLKMFNLMEMDKQMDSMRRTMRNVIAQQFSSPTVPLSPKQSEEMAKLNDELSARVLGPDYVKTMVEAMIPLYQRAFTRSDIDALIAFYSSVAGQKLLHKQPEIMAELMPRVMSDMQEKMRKDMDAIQYDRRMREILSEESEGEAPPKK